MKSDQLILITFKINLLLPPPYDYSAEKLMFENAKKNSKSVVTNSEIYKSFHFSLLITVVERQLSMYPLKSY